MPVYAIGNSGSFSHQLKTGWQRQLSVVQALIYKEFKIKLGITRIGLIWVLLEPVVSMIMISGIWLIIGRDKIDGVHTMLFIGAGFVVYIIIQRGLGQISSAISANESLLNYPQVKPIDTVIARFILEMTLQIMAAVLLFFSLWWIGDIVPVFHDPLMMLMAIGIAMVMSGSIGLLLATYGTFYPSLKKAVDLVTRPLMILSGIIYSIRDLPPLAREILSWNPIIHIVEYFRAGAFGTKLFAEHDLMYVLMITIVLLGFSMVAYYVNRFKLIQK